MSKNFKDFINEAEKKTEPAPAPAPAEAEVSVDSPEIALDPRLEKEIFIDSFEVNGKNVVIKSLGLGATKPVVVYIDDKRWEVFPGPRIAKREARRHVKKSSTMESVDDNFEAFLAEAVLTNESLIIVQRLLLQLQMNLVWKMNSKMRNIGSGVCLRGYIRSHLT